MTEGIIRKGIREGTAPPLLGDYAATCAAFSWAAERALLDGLPDARGLNIAHEAVDRHVLHGRGEHVALRWIAKSGAVEDFSYSRLAAQSSAFANVLEKLGVAAGERVFVLSDRIPELYIAALGTLKHRNVFCPMFSAFGPEPIHSRMSIGDARVLVTTARLYRRKVAEIRDRLPGLEHVLVSVVANLSMLKADAFWIVLDHHAWVHPYDTKGRRREFDDIPRSINELADDPFRSLAGELRRAGGFAKDVTPFSEFLWADFLRRRLKRSQIEKDFTGSLERALILAKSQEARYLPGWCGPNPP